MAFNPKLIANEFIAISKDDGNHLSPMKMQKLVYFAHGWFLALAGRSLICEAIEAWDYGPVVPSLYREFKPYGNLPITDFATVAEWDKASRKIRFSKPQLSDETTEEAKFAAALVRKVWDKYAVFSPIRLSNATHVNGSPWAQVYRAGERGIPIPDELIKDYFTKLIHGGSEA